MASYVGADTAELMAAYDAVVAVTAVVRDRALPRLAGGAEVFGSSELASVVSEFMTRWDAGSANLVGDGEKLAQTLDRMGQTLLEINTGLAEVLNGLNGGPGR